MFSHPDNQQAYTVLAQLLKKQVPKVSVLVVQVCGLFLLAKDDPTTMSTPLDLLQKTPKISVAHPTTSPPEEGLVHLLYSCIPFLYLQTHALDTPF